MNSDQVAEYVQSKRGSNGGTARAAKLTKEQRSAIAKAAAAKRWAKKDNPQPVNGASVDDGIHAEDFGLQGTVYPTYGSIERGSMPMVEHNITLPLATQPVPSPPPPIYVPPPAPIPAAPEPTNVPQRRTEPTPAERGRKRASKGKPVSKVYGQALATANREYDETVEELAYHDEMAARLKSKLPRLINTIRALGGTIDPQASIIEAYQVAAQPHNTMPYQQAPYQQPQVESFPAPQNNIDPALYQANSNPLPGLAPALANAPVITNKPLGGAIDLDFVPVDESEGPGLPKMGDGWH
jgi:hypothetical protein